MRRSLRTSRLFIAFVTALVAGLVIGTAFGPSHHTASSVMTAIPVPMIFGHQGAAGYRPEHTAAGYELAAEMGADFLEPDLVPTKDGYLVDRHESEISRTTDVASHPEFASLRTSKTIDGVRVTGWFTTDLTLAQLKTATRQGAAPGPPPT